MAGAPQEEPQDDAGAPDIDARHDPRTTLMEEVASQMDAIEADFGDRYQIGAVVTVVEVRTPEGANVRVRCNAPPWVGVGLMRFAEKALEQQGP